MFLFDFNKLFPNFLSPNFKYIYIMRRVRLFENKKVAKQGGLWPGMPKKTYAK